MDLTHNAIQTESNFLQNSEELEHVYEELGY